MSDAIHPTTSTPPVKSEPAPGQNPLLTRQGIIGMAVVLLILGTLGWGLSNSTETRPEAGVVAPSFEMQFFDGYQWQEQPVSSLDEMQGQVVVLNFWASWCVECRLEADILESTWRRYQDQNVVFVGIDYVDTEPKALAYLDEFNVTYPNAPDLRGAISEAYEITGVPETFIIDKSGVIRQVVIGPVNERQLTTTLDQLLVQ